MKKELRNSSEHFCEYPESFVGHQAGNHDSSK
jgi:hypothetical protein